MINQDVKIKNVQLNKLLHESFEEIAFGADIKILVNNTWITGTLIDKKGLLILLEVNDLSFSTVSMNLVVDVNDISAFGYITTDDSELLKKLF